MLVRSGSVPSLTNRPQTRMCDYCFFGIILLLKSKSNPLLQLFPSTLTLNDLHIAAPCMTLRLLTLLLELHAKSCLDPRKLEGLNPRSEAATDAGELPSTLAFSHHDARVVLIYARPCKAKKVKCGEEKPGCMNCERQGEACDYSIRLNWDGRVKKKVDGAAPEAGYLMQNPHSSDPPGAISFQIDPTIPTFPQPSKKSGTIEVENHGGATSGRHEAEGHNLELRQTQFNHPPEITPQRRATVPSVKHPPPTEALPIGRTALTNHVPVSMRSRSSSDSDNPQEDQLPQRRLHSADNQKLGAHPTNRGLASTTHPSRLKESAPSSLYPSPADSTTDSPKYGNGSASNPTFPHTSSITHMLPPYHIPLPGPNFVNRKDLDYTLSPENGAKRIRLSPLSAMGNLAGSIDQNVHIAPSHHQAHATQTNFVAPAPPDSPYPTALGTPPTPASSSIASEDPYQRFNMSVSPFPRRDSLDSRRLSVSSLLSGPPGASSRTATTTEHFNNIPPYPLREIGVETVTYGLDRGFPDLDISKNDDINVLNGMSTAWVADDMEVMVQNCFGDGYYVPTEFGFGLQAKETVFGNGGYYAKPVPVKIPRSLEPLPQTLLQNPMNLLYFHHFLNHTARILVPHDCSENPFRNILPQSISDSAPQIHPARTDIYSGPGKHQPPQPPPRLLRQPPRPPPQPTRTSQPHRPLGPRRLPRPPPRPLRQPTKDLQRQPRHSHHAGLARNHLTQHLRSTRAVAKPPQHGPDA